MKYEEYKKILSNTRLSKKEGADFEMNYKDIAKTVHALVKKPDSGLQQENQFLSKQINNNEKAIIQSVFSKYEVSGDALSFVLIPGGLWA